MALEIAVRKEPRVHPLILVLIAVSLGAFGQILLKQGMGCMAVTGAPTAQVQLLIKRIVTTPAVLCGLILYGISTIFWLKVLTTQELTYVYPMIAVSYALVTVLSVILLREYVPPMRWLSLFIICIGVAMLATLGVNRNPKTAVQAPISQELQADPHVSQK